MRHAAVPYPLAAGVVILALAGCAQEETPSATSAPASTTFIVSGAAARCVRPIEPSHLQDAEVAFAGTVTRIEDEVTTLRVSRTYRGSTGEQVQLRLGEVHSETLSGSGDFVRGRAYLLAVSDGGVSACLSGPADDTSLQNSYEEAFGN
ncbi:hypothetical protein GCM10022223_05310 [Kineosporia mesophila]|uniref:Lipoprotein n=1 Tax=Kineosporia mesophila TaxID=566012 RepID=A0ABP6YYC6_9ACTN|nr:hypothetical protein [Kineosporia mesophila]MCD5354259.1 hypothetical protein [Kineosporia mesophila]